MESIERLFRDLENENPTRFSLEQIQSFTSNFSVGLGSGAFGDVYKGILHTGVQVAVKVIKGDSVSEGIKDQFKAEVSVLCKTHHRNLVKLHGFCFEHNMKALIYEFMENESLDKLLYGKQTIEWEILLNVVIGAAKGLSYLHKDCEPRIIHYDIKPSNILLDSKFSPKLGDFGLAKLLNQDKSYITESRLRGTPNYVAPELCMPYSSITHKCDVYSYGITLFDIIGRRRHLVGEGQKWFPSHVWKKIEAQQHDELLKECGIQEKHREEAKRILLIALHCVQFVPEDRPSMSRVLRLLKGTEHVETPPNPFLYLGYSSRTIIGSSSLTLSNVLGEHTDVKSKQGNAGFSQSKGMVRDAQKPDFRGRKHIFVIAVDCDSVSQYIEIIKMIFDAAGTDRVSGSTGFILSTFMTISEINSVLVSGGFSASDFDAFICNSGGELYYPSSNLNKVLDPSELPVVVDLDYGLHIGYRWGGEDLRKTLVRWAASISDKKAGNEEKFVTEDEQRSTECCYAFKVRNPSLSSIPHVQELRNLMRNEALRCHVIYCKNGSKFHTIPVLASRAKALRYLYLHRGANLSNMVVFTGESGDSDYGDLLGGIHKSVILKGICQNLA